MAPPIQSYSSAHRHSKPNGSIPPQIVHDAGVIWTALKYAAPFALGAAAMLLASGWFVSPAKQTDLDKLAATVAVHQETTAKAIVAQTEMLKGLHSSQAQLQTSVSRMEGLLSGLLYASAQAPLSPPTPFGRLQQPVSPASSAWQTSSGR